MNESALVAEMARLVPVVVPALFSLVTVVGVVGNALVVCVFVSHRVMRDSTNALIINLASADLIFLCLCVPFTALQYASSVWPFATASCALVSYLQYVGALASVWTLALIAADRYLAVVHPARSLSIRTIGRAGRACAVVWLATAALCSPALFAYRTIDYTHKGENRSACVDIGEALGTASRARVLVCKLAFATTAFLLPLSITTALYTLMIRRLWSAHFERRLQSSCKRRFSRDALRAKRRVTRMMVVVTLVFASCWLPQTARFVWQAFRYRPGSQARDVGAAEFGFQLFAQVLAYANSCVNPIVYGFLSENFRMGFQNIIHSILGLKRPFVLRRLTKPTLDDRPDMMARRGTTMALEMARTPLRSDSPQTPTPSLDETRSCHLHKSVWFPPSSLIGSADTESVTYCAVTLDTDCDDTSDVQL